MRSLGTLLAGLGGVAGSACGGDAGENVGGASGTSSTGLGSASLTEVVEEGTGANSSGSTQNDPNLVVRVPDQAGFDWCAANGFPVHDEQLTASLFGVKYRVAFEPGVYPAQAGQRIPFRFELRDEERTVAEAEVDDEGIFVEPGFIDGSGYGAVVEPAADSSLARLRQGFNLDPSLGPEPWWSQPTQPPWLALVDISANPAQLGASDGEFILDPGSDFVASVIVYNTWFDPCELPGIEPDRTTIVLESGELVFETRRLRWTIGSGLADSAVGAVEGFTVDTFDYARVTYTDNSPTYMTQPVFAVKFDQPGPQGECAFVAWVFGTDPATQNAWFMDCSGKLLREIGVVDIFTEFAPPQTGLSPDPRAGLRVSFAG